MFGKSKALVALVVGAATFAALSYFHFRASDPPSVAEEHAAQTASGAQSATLDPALFQGPVREAYKVARQDPALLAQLHCYCGCDKQEGHRSLLDCFRTEHGSRCEICVGEAVEAEQLAKQGTPVEEIRDALRRRFAGG